MKDREWRTITLPEDVLEEVEKYIKTKEARRKGLRSISSFVSAATREKLNL